MKQLLILSALLGFQLPLSADTLSLIPQPNEINLSENRLQLGDSLKITSEIPELATLVEFCQQTLNSKYPTASQGDHPTLITFRQAADGHKLGDEGYTLEIKADQPITITAATPAGFFYGFQTVLQVLPDSIEGTDASIQTLNITDQPRFKWRGMHLDESRHFFGKDFVKKYIDLLAAYKMNVFHWHLIDDGGWRLEIKKYPKLTELGGFRKGSGQGWRVTELAFPKSMEERDSTEVYGGYYTQDDVREIVAYAKQRNVRVIPEIEMPGHSLPAISAYPELACGGDLVSDGENWTPSKQNSYCAGKEFTFTFLEDVLKEVMELFPDEYIHIGGDEVVKAFWNQCPHCQTKMRELELKNTNDLQSYFIKRMEKFLNAHQKRLIGWDEITHGGLAPNATVMFWIGLNAIPETVTKGHEVIMTPMNPCYFDFAYAANSTESVYQWDPVPAQFRGTRFEKQFLGAQGNVWTEWMETTDRVEYMIMPRMLAMAETLWTESEHKNLSAFQHRLNNHYAALDARDIHYRMPVPQPNASTHIFSGSTTVTFQDPPAGFRVLMTTDGSKPTLQSTPYTQPIEVSEQTTIRAVLVKGDRISEETVINCAQFVPTPAEDRRPGLISEYVEGNWQRIPDFSTLENVTSSVIPAPSLDIRKRDDHFACRFTGYIEIPESGLYTFSLGSDDGSILKLGEITVVNHDGPHGFTTKSANALLEKGIYPFEVSYLEITGGQQLEVSITPPNGVKTQIPASMLSH
ncbi:family 20 glycosylhydrolase [Sulfuriroseicoccus oceanibius]|uniref:beta-N-acetylhexosaminidase n=1 Tax=Sulfuriroseicoccus oceanibius TaxID=2707525 RepID=A0A6B3L1E4_9BACT|nr:family 20 glycosylhydrolase [Sulfuriroseicoccus oceanibius]QQL46126.1 family 20 glycosylhydrolase [Sulfuriroseicoccus oceanibius]